MSPQQADSTAAAITVAANHGSASARPKGNTAPSPAEIIKRLPKDATPAQQDSAVQASLQVENTHLSTRPDTLSLPGHENWTTPGKAKQPGQYIDELFGKDSLFYSVSGSGRYGVSGDPVAYTVKGDSVITALLILSFITVMLAIAGTRGFITRQAKAFFHSPKSGLADMPATTAEIRAQVIYVTQTCLLMSVITFIYTLDKFGSSMFLARQYQIVAVLLGVYVAYFAVKLFLYWTVNNVFFGRRKSALWLKSLLFITSLEGMALFPLVMLQSYFDLSRENVTFYMAFVIILVKMSLLYKSFVVFFKHKNFYLQIILYFCALEIMPLLSLWGILAQVVHFLKINF